MIPVHSSGIAVRGVCVVGRISVVERAGFPLRATHGGCSKVVLCLFGDDTGRRAVPRNPEQNLPWQPDP